MTMAEVIVFDDDAESLRPLNLTRPAHTLIYSFRPIASHIRRYIAEPSAFILPPRFKNHYTEVGDTVNPEESELSGDMLVINSSVRPEKENLEIIAKLKENTALVSSGRIAAVRTSRFRYQMLNSTSNLKENGIELLESDILLKGPWELVSSLSKGLEGRGVVYGERVNVEEPVHFDTSMGPVLVADEVRLEAFTRIEGPALIGRGTIVHSARINAFTYIGENCRVGGEVEHSVLSSYSNKAHFGYLGHSYIGEWVNVGAGSVTSDLKNTYGNVRVQIGVNRIDSGMVKLGSFIGDYSKVAINTSIYAGKKIGSGAHIYGLIDIDVAPFLSYDEKRCMELNIDSVINIARRMKKRRNQELGKGEEELIRKSYEESAEERRKMLE